MSVKSKLTAMLVNTGFPKRLFQQHHMRFFLKLEIDAEVIDIETGEITVSKFKFPQSSTWSIRLQSSLNSLDKALDELITSITNRPLGNTKRRLHKFLLLTLKVANRQFGGCKNYKNIDFKNKRCVVHPDGNDNLCFWRCLAIALFSNNYPNISKARNKIQRDKAQELRDKYYALCEKETTDIVLLDQIPDICQKLELNIRVNTLQTNDKIKERLVLLEDIHIDNKDIIDLHYDSVQKHFVLVKSFISYGDVLLCSFCGRVFDPKKYERLQAHELKHQKAEIASKHTSKLKFKKTPIKYMKTPSEKILQLDYFTRPFFLAFDFEAILTHQQEILGNKTFIHIHKPIAFVLKGWSAPDFDYKFEPVIYCGEDCSATFVRLLEERQLAITEALKKYFIMGKFGPHLGRLKRELCTCADSNNHDGKCKYVMNRNLVIQDITKIPILGFNSGKYDMTFVVEHLKKLEVDNLISKNNSYLKLSYGSYVFHDARNFVPPYINLDAFGKMWGVKDIEKEIFPYEWFDSVDKLNITALPPIEAFDNKLKNEKCKPEDYDNSW